MSEITNRLEISEEAVLRRLVFLESYGFHQIEKASTERGSREHWVSQIPIAAAATAFLEALELQLLVDPSDSKRVLELASRAIDTYGSFGMGIAALLRGIFFPYRPIDEEVSRYADSVERSEIGESSPDDDRESVSRSAALHSQSQQMMTWLGALSNQESSRGTTNRAMAHLERLHGIAFTAPYGVIGQPMGLYCETAMAAVREGDTPQKGDFNGEFVRKRAELIVEQSVVVESARRDRHAWNNLLAHIPFVDFSTLAVTLIGTRRAGRHPDLLRKSTPHVDVTAEIALRLQTG